MSSHAGYVQLRASDGSTVRVFLSTHAVDRYIERHAPGLPRQAVEDLLFEAMPTARQTHAPDRDGCARWLVEALDLPIVVARAPEFGSDAVRVVTVLPHRRERRPEVDRLADKPSELVKIRAKLESAERALRKAVKFIGTKAKADDGQAAAYALADIEADAPWATRQSFVEHGVDAEAEVA